MNKKHISAALYMESKIKYRKEFTVLTDPNGYLYADGVYPTKILPEDLPEWYVHGYMYKRHGYMSAKGVKYLLYNPNYTFHNHLFKYDSLFISYNEPIEPYEDEHGLHWYKGYDHVLSGPVLVNFVEAAKKYSGCDTSGIFEEIVRKKEFYYEKNPDAYKADYKSPISDEFGRRLPYRGRAYILGGDGGRKSFFDNCFCVPVNYSSEQIKAACVNIYRDLARRDLTEKAREFAFKMEIKPPNAVKINGAKTALGSCSDSQTLSFSWRLVTGEDDVIDYVIVSTLAYIIEPKRTEDYWKIVENIIPDYKERQERLRCLQERLKAEDWI